MAPLSGRNGWWPMSIREPYGGAWQRNDSVSMDTALAYSAVFSCTTLIMSDIGKVKLRLVEKDADGIWNEVQNPAYSPVLRRPNRYQNITQFKNSWMASKLNSGNTYVLKQRDNRNVVRAMYILDPFRVTPLVATDGAVYYELRRDDLSDVNREIVVVPASEIIHDRFNCLFHPLMGLSPLFACAVTAQQGLSIQANSNKMFANGSIPSGVLTVPGAITDSTAMRMKEYWETAFSGDNVGKVALLTDGTTYHGMSYNAVDMQLVEQLRMTGEIVCGCYHVPPYLVDIGPAPPYANFAPLVIKYHAQCLQALMTDMENAIDDGIGLGPDFGNNYGTEFDPDDLIWLDAEAKNKAAQDGIASGGMAPNEARKRYYGLGPVAGGDSPMVQQQYYSLGALAKRDAGDPFAPPTPAVSATPDDAGEDIQAVEAAFFGEVLQKTLTGLHDAP